MRIMGLDVGTKTIGVAVSDQMGWTAQGVTVIRRIDWAKDLQELEELAREYEVEKVVVGLPRRTDGSYGPEADQVRRFGSKLKTNLNLPIEYWDERFSTVQANRILIEGDVSRAERRRVIDKVAATVILQAYLDRRA